MTNKSPIKADLGPIGVICFLFVTYSHSLPLALILFSWHPCIQDTRLHDFDIGLASCEWSLVTAVDHYVLCKHYTGIVEKGANITVNCDHPDVMGRYLVFKIPGDAEILTLCEVEVYGGRHP